MREALLRIIFLRWQIANGIPVPPMVEEAKKTGRFVSHTLTQPPAKRFISAAR